MRLFTKLAVVATSGLATVGLASGAWAFYTASATAPATAAVGTVDPPTGVTAEQTTPGVGTVHVDWTAPAAPGGLSLTGYFVERWVGSASSPACASAPGALLAAGLTGCDDAGVAPGPYEYRVTAVYRTWTAASAPAAVTVDGPLSLVIPLP